MYRRAFTTSVLLLFLFSACAHKPAVPELFTTQRSIGQYIESGQYQSDCARVAGEAKKYLVQRIQKSGKLAIVLDIDETSLSNWPAYKVNGWARILNGECDLEKGPCNIRVWQAMAKSAAIPSTLSLAQFAHAKGVAVFFITGRPSELHEATEKNLKDVGYPIDGLILLPQGQKFASAIDFKSSARKKITEEGYTIILSMGDQWSDLNGGYAERLFKLPNPVYFLP